MVIDRRSLKRQIILLVMTLSFGLPAFDASARCETDEDIERYFWSRRFSPHISIDDTPRCRWSDGSSCHRTLSRLYLECSGGFWIHKDCGEGMRCSTVNWSRIRCVEDPQCLEVGDDEEVPIDSDNDGLQDEDEINLHHTDPQNADTDGDGLNDGDEINVHETNPTDPDTDSDGLDDGYEVSIHLNPNFVDNPALQVALEMIMEAYDEEENPVVVQQQQNVRFRQFIEFFKLRKIRDFQNQFFIP